MAGNIGTGNGGARRRPPMHGISMFDGQPTTVQQVLFFQPIFGSRIFDMNIPILGGGSGSCRLLAEWGEVASSAGFGTCRVRRGNVRKGARHAHGMFLDAARDFPCRRPLHHCPHRRRLRRRHHRPCRCRGCHLRGHRLRGHRPPGPSSPPPLSPPSSPRSSPPSSPAVIAAAAVTTVVPRRCRRRRHRRRRPGREPAGPAAKAMPIAPAHRTGQGASARQNPSRRRRIRFRSRSRSQCRPSMHGDILSLKWCPCP